MQTPLPDGTARQREIAGRNRMNEIMRELACESEIDWNRTDSIWIDINGDQIQVQELTDARLHGIICWAVQTCTANFERYATDLERTFRQPKFWLCERSLFRSLVVELARRELSLPRHIFQFIESTFLPQLESGRPAATIETPFRNSKLLEEQRSTLLRIQQAANGVIQYQPPRFIHIDDTLHRETD